MPILIFEVSPNRSPVVEKSFQSPSFRHPEILKAQVICLLCRSLWKNQWWLLAT